MGLKLIIMLVVVIILTIVGVTGGKALDFILPQSGQIVGTLLCNVGGYIVQPEFTIGNIHIPYPVMDDVAFGTFTSIPILYFIFRNRKERTLKKVLLTFFVIFIIMLGIYKVVGLAMVYFAEHTYGMQNCLDGVQVGGTQIINYSWYSPLFFFGAILAVFAMAGAIWKVSKMRSK